MSTDNTDDLIIIDPKASRTATAYKKESLIQKSALKDVIEFVKETRSHIKDFTNKLQECDFLTSYSRFHDTILIDGERGTGKTSFLLSAVNHLCGTDNPSSPPEMNTVAPISLGIIDPTLISTKENIFILVISRIKEYVDKHHRESISHEFDGKYQDWNEQLGRLSRGLCMQDGIGTDALLHEKWEDSQYIMQEGLSNAQGGLNLERNFHKFIQKSLEILNKDCFILCFDDTDTDFSKGWPVLELLRKYFTTPQLITLLSGDYALYAKLVRINQWKLFKDHQHAIYHYGTKNIKETIESLESQYLTKILPPNRRILLKNAWELLDHLRVKDPTRPDAEPIRIDNLFESFTALWYRYPTSVCRKIGDLFTHLPMRNIIHILHVISSAKTKTKTTYNAQAKDETTDGAQQIIEKQTYEYARSIQDHRKKLEHGEPSTQPSIPPLNNEDAILAVHSNMILIYYNNLINLGFAQYELNAIQWTGSFYRLSEILNEKRLIKNGASLLPANVMPQDGLDILLLSGIYTSAILGDIRLIFDYYIRVLLVRDILAPTNGKDSPTEDDFQYKQLFSSEKSLLDITTTITNICITEGGKHATLKNMLVDITTATNEQPSSQGRVYIKKLLHNYTTHVHYDANGKRIVYFSPFNAIALLALCVGSTGDFRFELERYTKPHTTHPTYPVDTKDSSPVGTPEGAPEGAGTTIRNDTSVCSSDESDFFNKLSDKIHESALKYHNGTIKKIPLLLPLYVHHDIWTDFIQNLNIQCGSEIDTIELLEKTYKAFTDSIENRYSSQRTAETLLAGFIKENTPTAHIDALDEPSTLQASQADQGNQGEQNGQDVQANTENNTTPS